MFDVRREGGVFDLEGGDGVDCVGAAEGGGGYFGEAEVGDFTFAGWGVRFGVLDEGR